MVREGMGREEMRWSKKGGEDMEGESIGVEDEEGGEGKGKEGDRRPALVSNHLYVL